MRYFDLEGARKKGYTDKEIVERLAPLHNYDASRALAEGLTESDIVEFLSDIPVPSQIRREREMPVPEWGIRHPNLFGMYGATKEVWEKGGKQALEALGLAGGAVVGTAAGPGAGTVAGAGLGYGMAKNVEASLQAFIDRLGGIKKEPTTVARAGRKAVRDVRTGMMLEMGGQLINLPFAKAIEKVAAPYGRQMTEGAKIRQAQAEEFGVKLTPADVAQTKGLSLIESVLEKSPTGADIIGDFRFQKQLEPLLKERARFIAEAGPDEQINVLGKRIWDAVDGYLTKQTSLKGDKLEAVRREVLGKLGTNASLKTVGLEGKELLRANSQAAMERAKQAFLGIGDDLSGQTFATPNLTEVADTELATFLKLPIQDTKVSRVLNWSKSRVPPELEAEIALLPESARKQIWDQLSETFVSAKSWDDLVNFHNQLSQLIRAENEAYKMNMPGLKFQATPNARIYGKVRGALEADMAAIAENAGDDIFARFKAAKAFYGEELGVWRSKEIKKLAYTNPEDLIDVAFVPNGITEVQKLKEALGAEGFFKMRQGFTNKLMGVGKGDAFDPKLLRRNLIRYGDEMLSHVFTPHDLRFLKQAAKDGLKLESQKPGNAFLRMLSKQYPDTVVDSIIGAVEEKKMSKTLLKNISMIRAATDKQTLDKLSVKMADKLFQLDQTRDFVSPTKFASMVDKYGERVLGRFFPKPKVRQLQTLADVARRITTAERLAGNPSGTAQTLITWGTAKMLFYNPVIGTAMLITPKHMAKLYTSPTGIRWLTEGLRVPVASKRGVELAAKIGGIISRENE